MSVVEIILYCLIGGGVLIYAITSIYKFTHRKPQTPPKTNENGDVIDEDED